MFFKLEGTSGRARAGVLETAHGKIHTPIFMPVGTRASVKTMSQADLEEIGAEIILGNTYHLYLRPGHDLVEEVAGDLHNFMAWDKPILTDSGGFQVFSLSQLRKITPEGVEFRSHIDGSKHFLGPKESMQIQKSLGSDIVMAFDECPALPATKEDLKKSLELTHAWAKICRDFPLRPYQKLFGIVQGGLDLELRRESLACLEEMDFPGLAIGGLSVGEKSDEMRSLLEAFTPEMPEDKPRYLMGVGKPLDIMHAIAQGVDMFDCVLPTRNARNGQMLTTYGPINIKREQYKKDKSSPDPECPCKVCTRYSKAYLRHLYTIGEYLAGQLITYHNLFFYLTMVKRARTAILEGRFDEYYKEFYRKYTSST